MKKEKGKYPKISDRLLRIIELKSITKTEFYRKTGLSNGFLDKANSIGSDKIEKIITAYPEISLTWLILGKGSPFAEIPEKAGTEKDLHERIENLEQRFNQITAEAIALTEEVKKTTKGNKIAELAKYIDWLKDQKASIPKKKPTNNK